MHTSTDNGLLLQWVAGIKKTGLRGTPPFLSLSTALIHPTPWFLSSGRGTQAQRAPARREGGLLGKEVSCGPRGRCQSLPPSRLSG